MGVLSLNSLAFSIAFAAATTSLVSCQKASGPSSATVGNQGGGTTSTDMDVEYEVAGSIGSDEPTDFVGALDSVEISGVNLTTSSKYLVSVFHLNSKGEKTRIQQLTIASENFSFKTKVPRNYLIIEVVRLSDSGVYKAVLPPPLRNSAAKLRLDPTSALAARILDLMRTKAASGDVQSQSALANHSVSVADVLMVARSVRLAVDEQKAQNSPSPIDLSALAAQLVLKSNEKMAALAAEGNTASSIAERLSENTYKTVFGSAAATASPGLLAYRTNHDLGTTDAAKKDVAYEAIKSVTQTSIKQVEEAYRVEATAYRTPASLSEAIAVQSQAVEEYKNRFSSCTANITSCASGSYNPPPPPASINSAISLTKAANPQASPSSGTYFAAQSVTLGSATAGASIYYTLDGTPPTTSSNLYSGPISLTVSAVVKVIAVKSGFLNSEVASFTYTINSQPSCPQDGWCPSQSKYYIGGVATTLNSSGSGSWGGKTYENGVEKAVITIIAEPSNQTASSVFSNGGCFGDLGYCLSGGSIVSADVTPDQCAAGSSFQSTMDGQRKIPDIISEQGCYDIAGVYGPYYLWNAPSGSPSGGTATFEVSATVTNGAALSYQWQIQQSGSGDFVDISHPAATTASLALSGLSQANDSGDVYRVRISATGGATARLSSSATLTVQPVPTIPLAPSNISVVAGNGQATVSWNAPTSNGGSLIKDYMVKYSSNGGADWSVFNDGESLLTSAVVTNLNNGVAYIFKVAALNTEGRGTFSDSSTSVTPTSSSGSGAIVIMTQPKNNYSTSWDQQVSFSVGASSQSESPSYQWQYYNYDRDGSGSWNWADLPGKTTAQMTISEQEFYQIISPVEGYYYPSDIKLRCIVSTGGGATMVNSDIVRFVMLSRLTGTFFEPTRNNGVSGPNISVQGHNYQVFYDMPAGHTMLIDITTDMYGWIDSSWRSGDAATLVLEESFDGNSWTLIDQRRYDSSLVYEVGVPPKPGETRYYRLMLDVHWPFTTTDGSSSVAGPVPRKFMGGVKATWLSP